MQMLQRPAAREKRRRGGKSHDHIGIAVREWATPFSSRCTAGGLAMTRKFKFRVWHPKEFENLPAPEWLVEKVLPRGATAVAYGEPNVGKTFGAISVTNSVATGKPLLGLLTVKVPTLYIASEGMLDITHRHRAWEHLNGQIEHLMLIEHFSTLSWL
jgi:hypothetical protein